jgi:Leucine-rich repeat (LRR) protein
VLSGNKLDNIPTQIGDLVTLEVLDLSNNPIASLPDEIGQLTSLRILNLSGTKISKAPKFLPYLVNLTDLYLPANTLDANEVAVITAIFNKTQTKITYQ